MRRMIPLLIAVLAFSGLLGFVLYGPKAAKKAEAPKADQLVSLKWDTIKELEVRAKEFTLQARKESRAVEGKEKPEDVWVFLQGQGKPEGVELDPGKVSNLVWHFPLEAKKKVAEGGDPVQYGLDSPAWTVRLNGGESVLEIGARNPAARGYYARLAGSNTIYLIPESLPDSLPKAATDWAKQQ